MSSTSNLNGYDEVLAITQNTINSQFSLICPPDNSGPIFRTWNFSDPKDSSGWSGLDVTQMDPPTVSALQADGTYIQNQLSFSLHLVSGTFKYYDFGSQATAPIDNWTVTFQAPLNNVQINSASDLSAKVTASDAAAKTLTDNYLDQSYFTIEALATMIEDANVLSGTVTATGNIDSNLIGPLLQTVNDYLSGLQDGGTPFVLGYPVTSSNPSAAMPEIPDFTPTSIEFSETPFPYNYDQSNDGGEDAITKGLATINYLMMAGSGNPAPTDATRFTFNHNWITNNDYQGSFAILNDLFRTGYTEQLLLPLLRDSMGIPGSEHWVGKVNDNMEYVYTIDYNEYPYKDEHGGKGHIVGTDSWVLNIYEELHNEAYLQVTVPKGDDVKMTGEGYFYQKADIYEYPIGIKTHDAWTKVKQPFTFTLTFSAGEGGSIQADFDLEVGKQTSDSWENPVYTVYDWLMGWVSDTMSSMTSSMNKKFSDFESNSVSAVENNTKKALSKLNKTMVLPNGDVFSYKDMVYDDQMNVLMHTTYINNQ